MTDHDKPEPLIDGHEMLQAQLRESRVDAAKVRGERNEARAGVEDLKGPWETTEDDGHIWYQVPSCLLNAALATMRAALGEKT